jgi:hypothetical protein
MLCICLAANVNLASGHAQTVCVLVYVRPGVTPITRRLMAGSTIFMGTVIMFSLRARLVMMTYLIFLYRLVYQQHWVLNTFHKVFLFSKQNNDVIIYISKRSFGLIGHLQVYKLVSEGNCYCLWVLFQVDNMLQPCMCSVCGFALWTFLFHSVAVLDMFLFSGTEAHCFEVSHPVIWESKRFCEAQTFASCYLWAVI